MLLKKYQSFNLGFRNTHRSLFPKAAFNLCSEEAVTYKDYL